MEHNQSNLGLDQCHHCGVRRKQVANPTTNYGFVLPTPTDLVTDLPADFDVALQGVDTQLKALQPGTTLGDLAYSSASANTNTRLAIGSTNDVLTVAGGVPTWAAPAGGGKVLQVVSTTYATNTTIASTSLTDTGLSLSITPTSATSKILVLITQPMKLQRAATSDSQGAGYVLLRGATSIYTANQGGYGISAYFPGITEVQLAQLVNVSYYDSPATTSSTTYKTQARCLTTANSGVVIFQDSGAMTSSITLLEIGA
jgi:hypothetical protein